jgi:S-adenosylmethionine hydrolase
VLHADVFGNVITNVGEKVVRKIPVNLGEGVEIRSGTRKLQAQYARSYYEVDKGAMTVLLGSQGFLEIAVREGNARDKLDVNALDKLEIRF